MIHAYKLNGYNIVLDVNSGCVHVVDEVAFDIISDYDKKEKDEIKAYILGKYSDRPDVTSEDIDGVFEDIEALKAQGKLFTEDKYRALAGQFKKRQSVIKAICLHVAHDCNLACKYCFACEGEYHGPRGLMSYEVGKRALDFLVENSGTRKNLEVDFFGGEPSLNFEVVKRLVEYGRSIEKAAGKNFRFTYTTNGVILTDEIMDFCNKEMSNVVLSLDGRKEVNDKMRVDRGGCGSYDRIVPKFKEFVDRRGGKDYYIRGTYTRFNKDFAADILHMADLGFKEISIEPVVAEPSAPYALREEDLPQLLEQYEILAKEMIKRNNKGEGFTFYHYMIDLDGGPCVVKRVSGCGVGTEYMAVTPEGDLYPCHQFVGNEDFLLGNVFDGVKNTEAIDQFKNCNIYSHSECDDCFARMYCSGGCAANAYNSTGSVTGVYKLGCELHKKRIECAIMIKAAQAFGEE
ncbi:MAG: thioether cross-link-forming SCIFF peptide maturase [Clostridia bacterium]|nr:thioether cross-link-forming SCIFF peptide maturase [Clostridia bacterium]